MVHFYKTDRKREGTTDRADTEIGSCEEREKLTIISKRMH